MRDNGGVGLVFVVVIIVVMMLSLLSSCATNLEDDYDIEPRIMEYDLAIGESISLPMETLGNNAKIKYDTSIMTIRDGHILAIKVGSSKVNIRSSRGNTTYKVNVYDRIVSKEYICESRCKRHYSTISSCLQDAVSQDSILVCEGNYEEHISVNTSLNIKGKGKVTISSLSTGDNISLTIDNICFYSRCGLGDDEASLMLGNRCRLKASYLSFLVDSKTDMEETARSGYAIYVCPYSSFVEVTSSSFEGYDDGIFVDGLSGYIDISKCKFTKTSCGIRLDIRDRSSNMPSNLPAYGKIGDNAFYDTKREVDFIYAGSSYTGNIVIEKHDTLD